MAFSFSLAALALLISRLVEAYLEVDFWFPLISISGPVRIISHYDEHIVLYGENNLDSTSNYLIGLRTQQ